MQDRATAIDFDRFSEGNTQNEPIFVREGELKDITSYPAWAQDTVAACEDAKQRLVGHDLWHRMRDGQLDFNTGRNFLIGGWAVVDQFPQYMAMNLLKTPYGISQGQDMARRWLIRNIRVEQNHAQYWMNWAIASGVSHAEVVEGAVPTSVHALSHWCWNVCDNDSLPVAMAATNYAIEGATGEWASVVTSNSDYENAFPKEQRRKAMQWLKAHAEYDDEHPWEALEIVCTLLGPNPSSKTVDHVRRCVRKSYDYFTLAADSCFEK